MRHRQQTFPKVAKVAVAEMSHETFGKIAAFGGISRKPTDLRAGRC
jgi:hypothetical protein